MGLLDRACVTVTLAALSCAEAKAPAPPPQPARVASSPTASPSTVAEVPGFPSGPIAGECTALGRPAACFESKMGFRWLHPLPMGMTLESVVAVGRNEAILVGDNATVLRAKGDVVTRLELPNLRSAATMFAEIDGVPETEVHKSFPGSQFWRPRLESIVRTGPQELLVLVDSKSLARFDGKSWSNEISSSSKFGDEIFGDASAGPVAFPPLAFWSSAKPLVRVDGKWVEGGALPPKATVRSGVVRDDTIWFAADGGNVVRGSGLGKFEVEPLSPPSKDDVTSIWIARDRRRGLAVTRNGDVYEREGETWHAVDPIADTNGKLRDVDMLWSPPDDSELWAVGAKVFRRKGNGAWRNVAVPSWASTSSASLALFEGYRFHAIDGTAADDVWIVGRFGTIMHFDGQNLRELSRHHTDDEIKAIHPLAGNEWLAFAADGTVLRGNGVDVVRESRFEDGLGSAIRAADGKLLVIDGKGNLFAREGDAWVPRPPMKSLYSAAGALGDSVFYSLGWDGRAERITPKGTTKVVHGVKEDLRAIAFGGPKDVWIVGDGIILRGDGTRFSVLARHAHDDYRAVSIRGPNDVWIAGDSREIGEQGLVLHWDGKKLVRYEHLVSSSFTSIRASEHGVWAIGNGGAAARFDGAQWKLVDTNAGHLDALWVTPDGTVIAGGDGGSIIALSPAAASK